MKKAFVMFEDYKKRANFILFKIITVRVPISLDLGSGKRGNLS